MDSEIKMICLEPIDKEMEMKSMYVPGHVSGYDSLLNRYIDERLHIRALNNTPGNLINHVSKWQSPLLQNAP